MNNFLTFIEKDIANKKTLIQNLPIKTKTNIKKFNETIETFEAKYEEYRSSVRNYLLAKSRSFEVIDSNTDIDIRKNQINDKVIILEQVKFLLNPFNTYVEKMGFDILLYQLSNYHVFNFNSLNVILSNFTAFSALLNTDKTSPVYFSTRILPAFFKTASSQEISISSQHK